MKKVCESMNKPNLQIKSSADSKTVIGQLFDKTMALKHTRGGRHTAKGVTFDCIRIAVSRQIVVMDAKSGARVYLIPTHENRTMVFFVQLNNSLPPVLERSNAQFREYISKLFSEIEMTQEDLQNKDLWIPNFSASAVEDNQLKDTFNKIEEFYAISLLSIDLKSDSTGDLLQRQAGDNSIILTESFIFGLVDSAVEEKLGMPLMAVLVAPDNFTKANST